MGKRKRLSSAPLPCKRPQRASCLPALPPELLCMIVDHFDKQDTWALSSTCRALWDALAGERARWRAAACWQDVVVRGNLEDVAFLFGARGARSARYGFCLGCPLKVRLAPGHTMHRDFYLAHVQGALRLAKTGPVARTILKGAFEPACPLSLAVLADADFGSVDSTDDKRGVLDSLRLLDLAQTPDVLDACLQFVGLTLASCPMSHIWAAMLHAANNGRTQVAEHILDGRLPAPAMMVSEWFERACLRGHIDFCDVLIRRFSLTAAHVMAMQGFLISDMNRGAKGVLFLLQRFPAIPLDDWLRTGLLSVASSADMAAGSAGDALVRHACASLGLQRAHVNGAQRRHKAFSLCLVVQHAARADNCALLLQLLDHFQVTPGQLCKQHAAAFSEAAGWGAADALRLLAQRAMAGKGACAKRDLAVAAAKALQAACTRDRLDCAAIIVDVVGLTPQATRVRVVRTAKSGVSQVVFDGATEWRSTLQTVCTMGEPAVLEWLACRHFVQATDAHPTLAKAMRALVDSAPTREVELRFAETLACLQRHGLVANM